MDKRPDYTQYEKEMYSLWETSGFFNPDNLPGERKESYTILIPPPNASGKMHTGNILMIAIEDLLIRWKRMQGFDTLYVPGTDHAGFETQITFERKLKEQGKSRLDYDRHTLYQMIWDFVQENKHLIEDQIRSMGASVDWSRYTFMLDDKVINTVTDTFKKLHEDGKVYRGNYMVNFCPQCGTTFADLEVTHKEQNDPLIYVRYPLLDRKNDDPEFIVVATVRPEPIFVDTHLAVNPKDDKKKHLIGRSVKNPLTGESMPIIGDEFVDPEFGTGVVKLTPAHDPNDYEVAKKHNLPIQPAFELDGTLNEKAGKYAGMPIIKARETIINDLKELGLIENIDEKYTHAIAVCYKGGHPIEPTVLPNWFVNVQEMKKPAHEAVKNGTVAIFPQWQEVKYHRWMEEMHDWPISRQTVWGIRIPVWYNVADHADRVTVSFLNDSKEQIVGTITQLLKKNYSIQQIRDGLLQIQIPIFEADENNIPYVISQEMPEEPGEWLPETDTFDTWFSSGHWPLTTLGYPDSPDFKRFYPTAVLETGWEILRFWVSRMIMFGLYLTNEIPFHHVYLHGLVRAIDGRKMSKSLGNVINPDEYQTEYGTDALRIGLISGTATGQDFNFPHDKIIGYKKFITKIWNMARFILIMRERQAETIPDFTDVAISDYTDQDREILEKLDLTIQAVDENLTKYRFDDAAETLYQFVWHDIADVYLEDVKNRETNAPFGLAVLSHVFISSLKLLHPFMPFVTEKIYQSFKEENVLSKADSDVLMVAEWPTPANHA